MLYTHGKICRLFQEVLPHPLSESVITTVTPAQHWVILHHYQLHSRGPFSRIMTEHQRTWVDEWFSRRLFFIYLFCGHRIITLITSHSSHPLLWEGFPLDFGVWLCQSHGDCVNGVGSWCWVEAGSAFCIPVHPKGDQWGRGQSFAQDTQIYTPTRPSSGWRRFGPRCIRVPTNRLRKAFKQYSLLRAL